MHRLSGYWQQLLGIVDTSQGEGGGILREKFWLCLYLSVAQNHIFFFRHYSLFHQDALCNSSSVLFILGPASIPVFLIHFVTLCRKCLKKTVVSYMMKCRSERISGLIRNLTALRDLRILEVRAGCATLQIMIYFPWSALEVEAASGLLPQSWK